MKNNTNKPTIAPGSTPATIINAHFDAAKAGKDGAQ